MGRSRGIVEPVAVFAIMISLFAAVLSVIGLVSEVVGVVQQTPVQRGIAAHPVRITATYTADDDGSKFHDPTYTLSYLHEDEGFSTQLRSLPGNQRIGDELCAEIDAEQPEHGRLCGTRGGLADAQAGLRTGGLFLGTALLVLLLATRGHNRSSGALRNNPARRSGNRNRNRNRSKPARRRS